MSTRRGWLFSLRLKLVAVLIPLMLVSMLLAMLGLSRFLTEFFRAEAISNTARMGRTVDSALRQFMLRKPELMISDTMADLNATPGIRRVWIIDKKGRIAHAADRAVVGRVLNRNHDSICMACHAAGAIPQAQTLFTRDEAGVPIIRHVRPIANEEACWGCHDSKTRLNGILLLEESTEHFHEAIGTVQRRLGTTGGITVVMLALVTLFVTTVFVERPVRSLMAGVRRIGAGDLSARVPVRGRDELAELAGSVNVMAEDLGHSLTEILNKNAELSVVYSILERLTKTIDLAELKEIILQTLVEVLGADQVLLLSDLTRQEPREILLRTRGVSRVHRIADPGEDDPALPDGFPAEIAATWLRGEMNESVVASEGRIIGLPIRLRDRNMGLLLVRRERPFDYAEANPKLLGALGDHIGVAFENARLYHLAITDDLTLLFTVRHFHSRIEEAVARHQRYGNGFGLLMLDLDHFKAVNDRWGHPAGNEVLRQVGRALLRSIRTVDTAYRYGGEEFAILLPEAGSVAARLVAERVRQEIEGLQIPLSDGTELRVTASIGIATCPKNGALVENLVASADAALYEAKRSGRNRASEPPNRPQSV